MRTVRRLIAAALLVFGVSLSAPEPAPAQDSIVVKPSGDMVLVRFADADLRGVVQALGRYLRKPVVAANIPSARVSLETPGPVPQSSVADLLGGLLAAQNLELHEEPTYFTVLPKPPPAPAPAPAAADATAQKSATIQLFVIRLKHARAADVAATVNVLFGAGGEFSGRAGLSAGTLSDELRRNVVPPAGIPQAAPPPEAATAQPKGATLTGPTVVVPDERTNSLLVRAADADFAVIRDAVDQLDIRPLQVLIEVLIVEARSDKSFSLGTDLSLKDASLGGGTTLDGTLTGGGVGDVVLHIMNLAKGHLDAILGTAQSKGFVQIVSRPVLLASNNTEAHFLVGSQRPFVQVSRALPTDNAARDQVVQYRDVGTKLTVRPTINQDGYVSLLIQQEINAATSEVQFDAPVISTREANTQVLVRDGQTIVLGGLRDLQKDRSQSGIPVLSGLPIVGGLFGSTSRSTSSTELYIFLTPRIIRTDADADSLTIPRLPKDSIR
jgi:general secretion pathway protein D